MSPIRFGSEKEEVSSSRETEETLLGKFFPILLFLLGAFAGVFVLNVPLESERRLRAEFNLYRVTSLKENQDLSHDVVANQKALQQTQEALRNTEKALAATMKDLAATPNAELIKQLRLETETAKTDAARERENLNRLVEENREALLQTQKALKATEEALGNTQKALGETLKELAAAQTSSGITLLREELEAVKANANREQAILNRLIDENRTALVHTQDALRATQAELKRAQKTLAESSR